MPTIATPDTCKAVVENATVQVPINDLFHVGPEKAILFYKPSIIDLFQLFKMIFNTPIILGILRFSGLVNRGYVGQGLFYREIKSFGI